MDSLTGWHIAVSAAAAAVAAAAVAISEQRVMSHTHTERGVLDDGRRRTHGVTRVVYRRRARNPRRSVRDPDPRVVAESVAEGLLRLDQMAPQQSVIDPQGKTSLKSSR